MLSRHFPFYLRSLLILFAAVSAAACGLSQVPLRHGPRPLVVGYFSNSAIESSSPFYLKNLVTSGSAARLDQINYASASVSNGHCALADPEADLETAFSAAKSVDGMADDASSPFRGNFHQLQELKRLRPRMKVLISLEGRASDFAMDARPENRAAFVSSCVDLYLRGRFAGGVDEPGIFDGVDIDWESPHLEDAANFRALLAEFRRQMNVVRPGLRLSVAVDQSPAMLPGTDFASLAPLVDEFGIMNYDYAGPWSATTGFLAPLFSDALRQPQSQSIESSIAAYKATGIPARKLLMGLPFYGYGWTGVSGTNHGLFQTGRALRGDHPYHSIRPLALSSQVFRDPRSQAPWIFDGRNFWTYEDAVSVRYKVSYASREGMGGVMIWELSGDTGDGELLSSAWRSLHHPLRARVFTRAAAAPPRRSAMVAQR